MVIGSLLKTVLRESAYNESLKNKIIDAFKDKDYDLIIYTIDHYIYSTLFKELDHNSNTNVIPIILNYIDDEYHKYHNAEWLKEQLGVLDKLKELLEWRTTDDGDSLFNRCIQAIDHYLKDYSGIVKPKKIYSSD